MNAPSGLSQCPCQIRLAPATAPFFKGAKLLIAADCTAYACAAFHRDFMHGKVTIVGCPISTENVADVEMLPVANVASSNWNWTLGVATLDIGNIPKSVAIVRMEVPCCGGLELTAKKALLPRGLFLPWQVVTISLDGRIIDS